eukprot:m.97217 g.97217  ORF g.97217 m.97217 type:complete len:682 (-) comp13971_c0_seq1:895-2940(-)
MSSSWKGDDRYARDAGWRERERARERERPPPVPFRPSPPARSTSRERAGNGGSLPGSERPSPLPERERRPALWVHSNRRDDESPKPTSNASRPRISILSGHNTVESPSILRGGLADEFSDISDDEIMLSPSAPEPPKRSFSKDTLPDDKKAESQEPESPTRSIPTEQPFAKRKEAPGPLSSQPSTEQLAPELDKSSKTYWLREMQRCDKEMQAIDHELTLFQERRSILLFEIEQEKRTKADGQAEAAAPDPADEEDTQSLIARIYAANHEKARKIAAEEPPPPLPSEPPLVVTPESFKAFRPALQMKMRRERRENDEITRRLWMQHNALKKTWLEKESLLAAQSLGTKRRELDPALGKGSKGGRSTRTAEEAEQEAVAAAPAKQPHVALLPNMFVGHDIQLAHPFIDRNRIVEDAMEEFTELDNINVWTEEEKTVFYRRFMVYPKLFHIIAEGLPQKSCAECVKFYYRTKKQLKYYNVARKIRTRKTRLAKAQARQDYRSVMSGLATAESAEGDAAATRKVCGGENCHFYYLRDELCTLVMLPRIKSVLFVWGLGFLAFDLTRRVAFFSLAWFVRLLSIMMMMMLLDREKTVRLPWMSRAEPGNSQSMWSMPARTRAPKIVHRLLLLTPHSRSLITFMNESLCEPLLVCSPCLGNTVVSVLISLCFCIFHRNVASLPWIEP